MKQIFSLLIVILAVQSSSAQFTGCANGTEAPSVNDAAKEQNLFDIVNQVRANNGSALLTRHEQLDRAARYQAEDMAKDGYLDHDSYDGGPGGACGATVGTNFQCSRLDRINMFYLGTGRVNDENLAGGSFFDNADSVVHSQFGWYFSGPHFSNMANPVFTEAGVGYYHNATSPCAHYWVVTFGNRDSVVTNVISAQSNEPYILTPAFPNPFGQQSRFAVQVSERQQVEIEVVNIIGQQVQRLHNGVIEAGRQQNFTIDANDLPEGVYFYRVKGEHFNAVRKIVLRK